MLHILSTPNVSPHEELAEPLPAILDDPEKLFEGEGSGHLIRIFQNIPGRQRAFKSRGQEADPGPSQGHTRTSPTPSQIYKGETEAAASVEYCSDSVSSHFCVNDHQSPSHGERRLLPLLTLTFYGIGKRSHRVNVF